MAGDFGVRVERADLGTWGRDELRSEYDPSGPVIRINSCVVDDMTAAQAEHFVALAVGHELYHHLERLGKVDRLADRKARERAADGFALELLRSDCHFERSREAAKIVSSPLDIARDRLSARTDNCVTLSWSKGRTDKYA